MIKSKPLPSFEYLNECFSLDKESGNLYWKHRPLHHFKNLAGFNIWNSKYPGKIAGCKKKNGYVNILLSGKIYLVQRIIWFMSTGEDPAGYYMDHINGNSEDNRLENLRKVNCKQNARNVALRTDGITWNKSCKKWQVQLSMKGNTKYIGVFEDKETAKTEAIKAREKFYGEFHRGHIE